MSRFVGFDHTFVATSLAWAFALLAAPAAADAPSRPVRIEYDAPAACPDARAFEGQLRARSARILISPDAKTTVRVRVVARGDRFDGGVTIDDPGGAGTNRHVDGGCADVAAALSLIAAVALDPMASTASDPTAPATTATSPSTPAATPPAPPANPATTPPEHPPIPVPLRARERDESGSASGDVEVAGVSRRHPWRWSVGGGVGVTGGVAPELLVSIPIFLDVSRQAPDLLSPSFRLRFERGTFDGGAGSADFTWTAGSLDVCPIALATATFRLWPCVRAEGGALEGTGNIGSPRTTTRPWVSGGALLRARLGLVGALFVEVEAGGMTPIVRDRFFVEPDETVHHAPVVALAASAGLGASFGDQSRARRTLPTCV